MSTFTDWNGPQGGSGARAADLIQLANAYSELVTKLHEHLAHTTSSDNVHQSKDYVDRIKAEITALIPDVSNYITQLTADARYAKLADLPNFGDFATRAMLANYAEASALNAYLKKNDLSTQQIILDIQADIETLQNWVNSDSKEIPELTANHVTGMISAVEQVKFIWKKFGATVGGSNDRGVFYILGQLDERAGTAYLRLTDSQQSFAAVVNFAITTELDAQAEVIDFKDGQLSVTTDVDKTDLSNVHFLIVKGTAGGKQHVYLAIQADEWMKQWEESGVINAGLFAAIPFEGAGINFVPVNSEGYEAPTGSTEVLFDLDYFALTDRMSAIEAKLDTITSCDDVGEITGWPKYDPDTGIATDVPDWAHACDGTDVEDPELAAKIGDKYPLQDYSIIRIKKTVEVE